MWRCLRRFPQSSSSQEPAVSSYGARTSLSGPRRLGGSGDRPFIPAYFLTVGSDAPTALAIEAIGSPPLALLRISSILSTPIIPLWPSSRRKPKQRHCWADCGWSACPCSKPKEFRAQARNFPTLKPATSRLLNSAGEDPVFSDGQMAAAVIDRTARRSRLVRFRGESYRVRHALMQEG